jgi:hypothetical protein
MLPWPSIAQGETSDARAATLAMLALAAKRKQQSRRIVFMPFVYATKLTHATDMIVKSVANPREFGSRPATSFVLQAGTIRVTFSHEDRTEIVGKRQR